MFVIRTNLEYNVMTVYLVVRFYTTTLSFNDIYSVVKRKCKSDRKSLL